MTSIILTYGSLSVIISKFVDSRYSRKQIPPGDNFDDYTPLYQWEFSCLLKPVEANLIHTIYLNFINSVTNNPNTTISIVDSTYNFFGTASFQAQFVEQPEYSEAGIYIRASIRLKEIAPNRNNWLGGVTISGDGSLYIAQKNMDNKYPWQFSEPSDSFEKDKLYIKKNQYEIVANLTIGEANTLKSIATSFITTLRNGGVPILTINDSTGLGNSSTRVWFIKPPSFKSIDDKKTDRYIQATISLREIGDEEPNQWNGSLVISNSGGSITLQQKYLSDKYPIGYSESNIDNNEDFSLRRIWEVDYRATREEANLINLIFVSYANTSNSEEPNYAGVVDDTLLGIITSETKFTKFPSYTSEDSDDADRDQRYVKVSFTLEEIINEEELLLSGSISISFGGLSITFLQKNLEEKFPRTISSDTVNKLSFSILGSTILEGYYFQVKSAWNITVNGTPNEANIVEQIGKASNLARINRQSPGITVVDSTRGNTVNGKAIMVGFPQLAYNKENKKKPVKITFSLYEI